LSAYSVDITIYSAGKSGYSAICMGWAIFEARSMPAFVELKAADEEEENRKWYTYLQST